MFDKTWEFWLVLIGMAVYVATRDAETESLSKRATKTAASGLLAVGLAPTISPYMQNNETIAAVLVMAFGLIILDLLTALILDREFIKDLIKKRIGGGKG
jgi:uncharacterized membrane protein